MRGFILGNLELYGMSDPCLSSSTLKKMWNIEQYVKVWLVAELAINLLPFEECIYQCIVFITRFYVASKKFFRKNQALMGEPPIVPEKLKGLLF